jgi:hypothetical protein
VELGSGAGVKLGSDAHKQVFCRQFMLTRRDYDPETLPWPDLDPAALQRMRAVPFWQEVLHTEKRAGAIVKAFTETIEDPLLKEAVAMQGFEEARHADLLRVMIRRYGLDATEQPLEPLPADIVTAFKDFGFGECMDSFLGFGVFKIARTSEFLPEAMFEIFDTLMYEETRHVVFFVNWMAWSQARKGVAGKLAAPLITVWFYLRALSRMMGLAKRGALVNDGKDFAATQAGVFLDNFTFRGFLEDCYGENKRRMGELDPELIKPSFLPQLTHAALSALRLWSLRHPRSTPAAPA